MRQVLADRPVTYAPPASGLESRLVQILAQAGQAPLRRQIDSGDELQWIGRVDFRDEHRPFVLEIQSERFHTSLSATQDDLARIERLTRAGFEVAEVTDTDVWLRPGHVVQQVIEARRRCDRAA